MGKNWVLLAAGSYEWENYRHQADVCHAYHVVRTSGVSPENIVLMMYDDIANNPKNPKKGEIFNNPGGPNVYAGVKIDYKSSDVTSSNFLAVLRGDKGAMLGKGTGKVIDSGEDDNIFVYFADHGGPGFVAFPSSYLYANQLNQEIELMITNKRFKQMVFYIEACYSGSMFENILPKNEKVWATTAANAHESSYACYMDKRIGAFLGDLYSISWMEDSDITDIRKETLIEQYGTVRKRVAKPPKHSTVMKYGDDEVAQEKVAEFQGSPVTVKPKHASSLPQVPDDAIASCDVPMAILRHKQNTARSEAEKQAAREEIQELEKHYKRIDAAMKSIVEKALESTNIPHERVLVGQRNMTKPESHQQVVEYFHKTCLNIMNDAYASQQTRILLNLREEGINSDAILRAIDHVAGLQQSATSDK